ncbi:MAG: hypothetical protein RLZZ293_447 [Pseudomonadota bacterium]|jgi:hypothetical protein
MKKYTSINKKMRLGLSSLSVAILSACGGGACPPSN